MLEKNIIQSINDETLINPSLNTNYFNITSAKKYWSSTTLPNQLKIPIIIAGGAGKPIHFKELLIQIIYYLSNLNFFISRRFKMH